MKIGAIIQARMGSTRLPGKVLKTLVDKPVLQHVIERVSLAKALDTIIVATTDKPSDLPIVKLCNQLDIPVFCGDEDDVLARYYHAAKEHQLDVIVRITSDCPLIDAQVIDKIVSYYCDNTYDIVSNAGANADSRTYPRGLDTEVFSFYTLESTFKLAKEKYQREHVTPFIYEHSDNVYAYKNEVDYSMYRWTLDTLEDFQLISQLYDAIYDKKHDFYLDEIIKLYENDTTLNKINEHINQKCIYLGSNFDES